MMPTVHRKMVVEGRRHVGDSSSSNVILILFEHPHRGLISYIHLFYIIKHIANFIDYIFL